MEYNIYIYGIHPIIEAINLGYTIYKIYIQKGLQGKNYKFIQTKIKKNKIPFQIFPKKKIVNFILKNHQGIFAMIAPIRYQNINNLIPKLFKKGKNPLFLILDRITDVRNFGSIVRTAECGGVDAILIPLKGSTLINSDAIKTSSGAFFRLPICREVNLYKSLVFMKKSGIQIVAATEKSSMTFYEIDFSVPIAIIIGNEHYGITSSYLSLTDKEIKLPVLGKISSMNVSVVCGILIYEALRSRYTQI